jgi:hypothetical protein
MPKWCTRQLLVALVLGVLASTMAACGSETPEDELESKLEFSVQANDKAAPQTASLTCPGAKAKDRDICAALDVVAPKVFEPVPVDQACTAIYGGPRKATITGRYQNEPVSAVFTQENGCEIARWNQIKPVLDALGLNV